MAPAGRIWNLVTLPKPQEISQRSRIRAAPDNAAFAGEPFEVTNHMHAEIAARRQRRRAHPRRVKRLARLFDERVKTSIEQELLKTVVKHMAWRTPHLRPGHHEVALDLAFTTHRHRRSPPRIFVPQTESGGGDFVNTLLIKARGRFPG